MQDFSLLARNPLFAGLSEHEIHTTLHQEYLSIRRYVKGSHIATEGDECNHIGIIVSGLIEVQAEFASGKTITIHRLKPNETYGEAIIFSHQATFPASLYCPVDCEILVLSKLQLQTTLNANKKIMENFLGLLSDRLLTINHRIKILSMETLRQRIASYLLEEKKKYPDNSFHLGINREQMARLLNVQRPSLSRELSLLKDEGIIDYTKDSFKILSLEALEEIVTEAFG